VSSTTYRNLPCPLSGPELDSRRDHLAEELKKLEDLEEQKKAIAIIAAKLGQADEMATASGKALVAIGERLAKIEAAVANTIEKQAGLAERVRRIEHHLAIGGDR
jgi:hypothetical protein